MWTGEPSKEEQETPVKKYQRLNCEVRLLPIHREETFLALKSRFMLLFAVILKMIGERATG